MTWNSTISLVSVAVPNDILIPYPWLTQLQNIFLIFACLMSVALLVIIYSYLCNMNSVSECILLHLYKDFVAILIISRISLVMKGIVTTFTITDSQNVATMNQLTAKIVSFSFISLAPLMIIQTFARQLQTLMQY